MKCHLKYIIIPIFTLLNHSCIKENFGNCPNWGKYKVSFYDSSNVQCSTINHILLQYNGIDSISDPLLSRHFLMPHSTLIDSPNLIKLFPGDYNFCALLSSDQIFLNDTVKFKNGLSYFYANTKDKIEKSPLNKVNLFFNLANSMIEVQCLVDSCLKDCNVFQVAISPPEDKNRLFNLSTGKCTCEQVTTDFFENAVYNNNDNKWVYYCNPLVAGTDLTFKITLLDTISNIYKVLNTKTFLHTGLEQGKVSTFYLNVTPHKIEYVSSTIIDWIDYIHYDHIEL